MVLFSAEALAEDRNEALPTYTCHPRAGSCAVLDSLSLGFPSAGLSRCRAHPPDYLMASFADVRRHRRVGDSVDTGAPLHVDVYSVTRPLVMILDMT